METVQEAEQENSPEQRVELISWTVRLSDSNPSKLLVIFGVAVTAAVLGYVVFGQLLLGLLGFAIILGSTAEYWMGARYKVDESGASRAVGLSVSSIDWEKVERVAVEGRRIRLSPFRDENKLDPFRGVTLEATNENKGDVLAAVKSRCSSDVRFLES